MQGRHKLTMSLLSGGCPHHVKSGQLGGEPRTRSFEDLIPLRSSQPKLSFTMVANDLPAVAEMAAAQGREECIGSDNSNLSSAISHLGDSEGGETKRREKIPSEVLKWKQQC